MYLRLNSRESFRTRKSNRILVFQTLRLDTEIPMHNKHNSHAAGRFGRINAWVFVLVLFCEVLTVFCSCNEIQFMQPIYETHSSQYRDATDHGNKRP